MQRERETEATDRRMDGQTYQQTDILTNQTESGRRHKEVLRLSVESDGARWSRGTSRKRQTDVQADRQTDRQIDTLTNQTESCRGHEEVLRLSVESDGARPEAVCQDVDQRKGSGHHTEAETDNY
jgi:hypothetical protein